HHLDQQKKQERCGGSDEGWYRHERAGTDEIERRQQAEGQGSESPNQNVVLADRSRQHHSDEVCWKHGLAVRPSSQCPHPEQTKQQEFGFQFGGAVAVELEKTWCQPGQDQKHSKPNREE